ncbi:hypothetical protein A4X13_0g1852 [Tilletia indica]|uniref:F-box domain-containing protein n=1 Tax=Tilletia indica TaxID=43049 RepID=A0A8T8T9R4_9BASI|nr:hypothetical protein A4X13_0g1852 [Tilletia indica]
MSSLGLPTELLLQVLRLAVTPPCADAETLSDFVARCRHLQLVNRLFRLLLQREFGSHLHAFHPHWVPSVRASTTPWIVAPFAPFSEHRAYWSHYSGPSVPELYPYIHFLRSVPTAGLCTLRTLSLDVRAIGAHHPGLDEATNDVICPANSPLSIVVALLFRLSMTCFQLFELNIRLPPYQPIVNIVERIVARNLGLRRIHIDIDSTIRLHHGRLLRLDLSNLVDSRSKYRPFRKFVLRAPGCNICFRNSDIYSRETSLAQQRFMERVSTVTEFALVCSAFIAATSSWEWLHLLFSTAPTLRHCEFSVHEPDRLWSDPSSFSPASLWLPCLQDLVVQVPDVDSHLLRLVSAPGLLRLKVRSSIEAERWPSCPDDHFPVLAFVHVLCPSPSLIRLQVLGIPQRMYERCQSRAHNASFQHLNEILMHLHPDTDHSEQGLALPFTPSDVVTAPNARAQTCSWYESLQQGVACLPQSVCGTNLATTLTNERLTQETEIETRLS